MAAPHILLVDDHSDSRYIYSTILERRGFSVTSVQDGAAAIRQFRVQPPDLLLLDLYLPGEIQGWDVLREFRGQASTRRVPCMVVTADARAETRRRAKELGCTAFLAKPLDPSDLVREVARTLDRWNRSDDSRASRPSAGP